MGRTARAALALALTCAPVLAGCSQGSHSTSASAAGGGSREDGSFCSLLVAFRTSNDALAAEVNSGDPARTEAAISKLASRVDLLRTKAPPDQQADVDTIATYVHAVRSFFADHGDDIDVILADEAASVELAALVTPNVDGALAQLRSTADAGCGVPTTTT